MSNNLHAQNIYVLNNLNQLETLIHFIETQATDNNFLMSSEFTRYNYRIETVF